MTLTSGKTLYDQKLMDKMAQYYHGPQDHIKASELSLAPELKLKGINSSESDAQLSQDVRLFQILAAAIKFGQEPVPITINNISSSQAEAAQKMEAARVDVVQSRPSLEVISEMFHTFFSSGFNKVCFFGMCGMGMYVYWSYLDHKWHMAEVQRRIDSNLVLKMSQWMFSDKAMFPQANASAAGPSRWFPLW